MSSIIQSQGLKFSIIQYIGVFIGIISTLLIYPQDLSLYGFYGFLTNTASLLAPIISLGFGFVLLRYFPHYRQEGQPTHSKFIKFIYSGYGIGIISFVILFLLLSGWIANYFFKQDELVIRNLIYLLPLTILFVIYEFLTHWSTSYKEIALPALLSSSLKFILPCLFLFVIHGYFGYKGFLFCLMAYYLGIIIFLIRFLSIKENLIPRIQSTPEIHLNKNELIQFALYSMITGTSTVLILRIDSLMITSQLGTEANGMFSMMYFISNAAFIPANSLYEILSPFVSKDSKENNLLSIQIIYTKSVRNMLIPTLWASFCLYFCFDSMMTIIPNGEKLLNLKTVLLLLLTSRIIDASTGVNHHILSFSKYYKLELILLFFLASTNIGLNILLIPIHGILGSAIATCVSVSIFNISKSFLIYFTSGYKPFDHDFWLILLCGALVILISSSLPKVQNHYMQIGIQIVIISIIFLSFLWLTNMSLELRNWISNKLKLLNKKSPQ